MPKIDFFMAKLESELQQRYDSYNPATTNPSTILLAVLNAVAKAREETIELYRNNLESDQNG